jgi:hypothetical protein
MADAPELGTSAALAGAIVALARLLEFIIAKLRGPSETPADKLADRLMKLEIRLAVVESRAPVNDQRFEDIISRLERLDEKLDRNLGTFDRGGLLRHRGER